MLNRWSKSKYYIAAKQTLSIAFEELTNADVFDICDYLNQHPEITSLCLFNCCIGSAEAKIVAEKTKYLKSLDISSNKIGDEGAIALAKTSLSNLGLQFCDITDIGAIALAKSNLVSLNLSGNAIGDQGAKALASNPSITTLDLSCNYIKIEGAKAFTSNTSIISLELDRNKIDGNEIDVLMGMSHPLREANHTRHCMNSGYQTDKIKAEVPSLLKLSAFAVKQNFPDFKEQAEKELALPSQLINLLS